MSKWIGEWVILSVLVVLGAGMLFILCWPLLPDRVSVSVNVEGVLSITLLLVVISGFGKLMADRG